MPINFSIFSRTFLLVCFFCAANLTLAQKRQIKGTLIDQHSKPVPYASVQLIGNTAKVIAFRVSDAEGKFALSIPDTLPFDQFHLEINHLGYQKLQQTLIAGQLEYPIRLSEQAVSLAEVNVRSRPRITLAGDTLLYDIESFAKTEDRTIGDVIKRLPGMEVDDSGLIKFNGRSISKLYIDGDDLLADRYAVGTKAIPYSMVKGLEVMQNHQEKKVLKNRILSDAVALNLVIKDDAKLKLSGNGKAAAGLPEQVELETNTILFNKRYKMLNALNANNIGQGLRSGSSGPDLLSTGTVGFPNLPKSRYLFNRSASLNANHLKNTEKGFQWKASGDLFVDKNDFTYWNLTELYTDQDTVRYNEYQHSKAKPFGAAFNLQGQQNQAHFFFSNEAKLSYLNDDRSTQLTGSQIQMDQYLRSRQKFFSNRLEFIPLLSNGQLLSLRWYLDYQSAPQKLMIEPGINAEMFNQGEAYSGIGQYADMPGWTSEASLSYSLGKGKIKKSLRASLRSEAQTLKSALRIWQAGGPVKEFQEGQENNLRWRNNESTLAVNLESKARQWEWVLSLPLTFRHIHYFDPGFDFDESKRHLLVQPDFRVRYKTGQENYLDLNYAFKNETGTISDLFRGVILRNYRSLYANESELRELAGHTLTLNYHHRKTLQMLFLHAGLSVHRSAASHIASSRVDSEISRIIQLPFENYSSRLSANAGISKYIFPLGATASLKVHWSSARINQFFNDRLLPYQNVSLTLSPEVEIRLFNKVSVNYRAVGGLTTSKAVGKDEHLTPPRFYHLDESLSLNLILVENLMIRASARHFLVAQSGDRNRNFMFADAFARYRLTRWKSDLELDLRNIANVRSYESFSLTANQYMHDRYELRGRMLLVRYAFNF